MKFSSTTPIYQLSKFVKIANKFPEGIQGNYFYIIFLQVIVHNFSSSILIPTSATRKIIHKMGLNDSGVGIEK